MGFNQFELFSRLHLADMHANTNSLIMFFEAMDLGNMQWWHDGGQWWNMFQQQLNNNNNQATKN